jgi:hypothetical protein
LTTVAAPQAVPQPQPRPRSPGRALHLRVRVLLLAGVALAIAIGWIFRAQPYDYMQHDSDAAVFFETASTGDFDFPLDATLLFTENQIPIAAYAAIYDLMAEFGLPPDPLGGILLNALLVVAAQALALRYARRRFGFDDARLLMLAALMASNGVLMMFAGIHMRDAFLLFTAMVSVVVFHPRPGGARFTRSASTLLWLVGLMAVSFLCRKEGFAVPLIVYGVSIVSVMDFRRLSVQVRLLAAAALFLGVAVAMDVFDLVADNYAAYKLLTQDESAASSIAYYFLYELPFPLSTLAGMLLLLFVKVPFWRSGLYDSYSFYVTLAALQMLLVAPVFIGLAVHALRHRIEFRHRYLMLIVTAMLLVTALTSNQVRHVAIVYPVLLIACLSWREIVPARRRRRFQAMALTLSGTVMLLGIAVGAR